MRDVLHRAVDLGFVNPHATFAGRGDHRALVDQRIQGLAAQIALGGQAHAGARSIGLRAFDAALHLTGGDEFLVDHRSDVVAIAHGTALRPCGQCHTQQGSQHGSLIGGQAREPGRRKGPARSKVSHGGRFGGPVGVQGWRQDWCQGEALSLGSSRSRR